MTPEEIERLRYVADSYQGWADTMAGNVRNAQRAVDTIAAVELPPEHQATQQRLHDVLTELRDIWRRSGTLAATAAALFEQMADTESEE